MIVYFADRTMSVLGHATTNLPYGYVIKEDLKTEDVNTGVASFSCTIGFTAENRTELEVMTNAGNYLLRSLRPLLLFSIPTVPKGSSMCTPVSNLAHPLAVTN